MYFFWTNKQKTSPFLYLSNYPLKCLMTISAFLYWKLSNEISYESGWSISVIKTVQWNIKAGHNWQNNVRTSIDIIIIIIPFNFVCVQTGRNCKYICLKRKIFPTKIRKSEYIHAFLLQWRLSKYMNIGRANSP